MLSTPWPLSAPLGAPAIRASPPREAGPSTGPTLAGEPGTPAVMSGKGELPATFLFQTREGGMGMLQIVGGQWGRKPRQVNIRYKILGYAGGGVDTEARPELKLEPVCWEDGEVLQLAMQLQTGLDIGAFITTAEYQTGADSDECDRHIRNRRCIGDIATEGACITDLDRSEAVQQFTQVRIVFHQYPSQQIGENEPLPHQSPKPSAGHQVVPGGLDFAFCAAHVCPGYKGPGSLAKPWVRRHQP